jgi:hypothetical protein
VFYNLRLILRKNFPKLVISAVDVLTLCYTPKPSLKVTRYLFNTTELECNRQNLLPFHSGNTPPPPPQSFLAVSESPFQTTVFCFSRSLHDSATLNVIILKNKSEALINSLTRLFNRTGNVQGGSNMTGTNCDLFTHK